MVSPPLSKDVYCSGAGAAKEARLLLSNYRMQAHSFGIFCWPGCFWTTFDSAFCCFRRCFRTTFDSAFRCFRRCFQTTFDSVFRCFRTAVDSFFDVSLLSLSLSPVIAVMSCRSPGVLVFQYQVGNEVFWRAFGFSPMLRCCSL